MEHPDRSFGFANPVSVIIPITKNANNLITAVCSALQQPACAEVLLVDDGASPHSHSACRRLAKEFSRVKLIKYPTYGHDTPSLLNYVVCHCKNDLVAFLSPDGYYLPHRFAASTRLLGENPEVDGVYEGVTHIVESPGKSEDLYVGLPAESSRSSLFDALVSDHFGHLDLSGLLIRRKAIQRAGLFVEGAGDSDTLSASMIKFAATNNLVSLNTGHPVTVRRLKERISPEATPLLFARLIYWSEHQNIPYFYKNRLLRAYLKADIERSMNVSRKNALSSLVRLLRTAGRWPSVIRQKAFWRCLKSVVRSAVYRPQAA